MTISEKLAALGGPYDPNKKPFIVNRVSYLFWCIPINRFDCNLRVVDEGDWWRVMYSTKCQPFFGADFRKAGSLPGDDPITWKYEKKWQLAPPSEANEVHERIAAAVDRAYEQYVEPSRHLRPHRK
jgi:hypothetical protein